VYLFIDICQFFQSICTISLIDTSLPHGIHSCHVPDLLKHKKDKEIFSSDSLIHFNKIHVAKAQIKGDPVELIGGYTFVKYIKTVCER
jgi:hypothetical protein